MALGRRSPFGKGKCRTEDTEGTEVSDNILPDPATRIWTRGHAPKDKRTLSQPSETSVPLRVLRATLPVFPNGERLPCSARILSPWLAGLITQEPALIERDILLRPEQNRFLFPFLRGFEIPGFGIPGGQNVEHRVVFPLG
jgi:hypothetical protein